MKKGLVAASCGMFSAVAAVLMLAAYFPSLTYAIPAMAGVLFMIPFLEFGARYAWLCYAVSALLTFFMAETEAKVLYILFFGFYPILHLTVSRWKNRPLKQIVKFAIFNASVVLAYVLLTCLFGIPFVGTFGLSAEWFAVLLLAVGNAVFAVYDLALDRLYRTYCFRWRKRVRKIFQLK